MKFPYVEHSGRLLPVIPIELKGKGEWLEFDAYLDSGAGYSIFHSDVAEIIGIKIEKGKEDYVIVGDGSQIKVFIHKVRIRLGRTEFEAMIGFSRRLGIGFNVLGQKDIFDRFKICFDRSEKIVELNPKIRWRKVTT